ncbi:MAG TPA: hypothetical protein VGX94_13955, partial [Terriglobia bacterium]|nr:hypothetical protein [Terriglobia bacterium]
MPDQPKSRHKEEPLVSKLVKDPKAPPSTLLLSGFLGNSSEEDHTRLYLDPQLSDYVEIPNDAILHTEEIPKDQSPLGGTYVWIQRDAQVIHGKVGPDRPKAKFLEGQIQQQYMQAAGGAAPVPALPITNPAVGCHLPSPLDGCPPPPSPVPCGGPTRLDPAGCPPPTPLCPTHPVCPPPPTQFCPSHPLVCPPPTIQLCPSVGIPCPPPPTHQLNCPSVAIICPPPTQICPTHPIVCPPPTIHLCPSVGVPCPPPTQICPTHPLVCPPPPTHQVQCPSVAIACPPPTPVPELCPSVAHAVCPRPSVICLSVAIVCPPPTHTPALCPPPVTLPPHCPVASPNCPPPGPGTPVEGGGVAQAAYLAGSVLPQLACQQTVYPCNVSAACTHVGCVTHINCPQPTT